MNFLKQKLATTALILGLANMTYASTLTIKSEETAEVDIIIEPGDGTMMGSKESIKSVLKPGEEITLNVEKERFHKETFSVKGTVKIPSVHNTCGPLFINKNYKIVFTGSKMGGTICVAQQLAD